MPKLQMFRSPADQAKKDLAGNVEGLTQFETLWNIICDTSRPK